MPRNAAPRRTQFSSCDACRHSRVACDASKFGHQASKATWRGSCSRCSRRKRPCTFECDYKVGIRNESDMQCSASLNESYIRLPESNPAEPLSSQVESAEALLTRWSDDIFHHGFETIFGLLIGRNGCPFVNSPTSNACIPATKLFGRLDTYMDEELSHGYTSEERRQQRGHQIDQSLRCAIQSFAARWLPLVSERYHLAASQVEAIIRDTWRAARKDMLKVINRASYRSILTLYLFAQTPTPVGVSEDEELDGISGSRLRERQRSCQLNGSEVANLTQAYLDLESRAYWAAVMWDTSSSLTLNFRTSLTSGLKGACSEPAWRLARSFLCFEASDEAASRVISAAAVCKLYVWKNIASLKEALREGVDEDGVLFAWNALRDAMDIFKTTIRPLLNNCERRLHFLDQVSRLSWYEVSSQYYLGILVLVDAIEAADRSDLLPGVTEARQDAEHESFNVLKFGVESTYTFHGPGEDPNVASKFDGTTDLPRRPMTASFVAIDPYPHHVVDSVLLMGKVIGRKYRQGKIKQGAYSHLSSTLLDALGQLPQSSKSVQAARANLQRSLHKVDAVWISDAGVRAT
ncbi:hypothetical protein K505DRAFT_406193 [Melanomma pulvis-pyrius CBS 109.77]|uniref:Zn(2)-C6 fungal-type domain-containing protein n=1 Tax=Melanomma pulvis-pyrius CBS 109.77 TaxID=1314802 RepID=A0A6A6XMC6_9PLEO|nr:hypothetical protein K505DRAFT_406193 [Melanomma pulvis-pyrius CBS 109.77]